MKREGRAAGAVPALPKSFGGDKLIVPETVKRCPLACSPSCSYRCPVPLDAAVTDLVLDLLGVTS